jgi:hypothetical protein
MKEEMTFEEWMKDDRNFAMVLREAERQGLLLSFIDEDGKTRWRRTDKQSIEPVTNREKLN